MKNFAWVIVGLCVLIIGGIFFLNYTKMEPVVQSARDADILNSDNLIAKINVGRAEKSESSFVKDTALIAEARKSAEKFEGIRFDAVHGDYYSVTDFLATHPVSDSGTRIGAWVTYTVERQGEKPVAYVVIIVK